MPTATKKNPGNEQADVPQQANAHTKPTHDQINWPFLVGPQVGVPALAYGFPGIGKTATIGAVAQATNRRYLPVMLSRLPPEDLAGVPTITEYQPPPLKKKDLQTGNVVQVKQKPVKCFVKVRDIDFVTAMHEPSVVLFDELGSVPHATQVAAMGLIQEGFGPQTWVFAAGNPESCAAQPIPLTAPMANRLLIVDWEMDVPAWRKGFTAGGQYGAPNIPIVPRTWKAQLSKWATLLDAYLNDFPDHMVLCPEDHEDQARPWPSWRAWDNLSKVLAAGESVGFNKDSQLKTMKGLLGDNIAAQLYQWIGSNALPDFEDLLAMPALLPQRIDLAFACLKMIVGTLSRMPNDEHKVECWEKSRDVVDFAYKNRSTEIAVVTRGSLWRVVPRSINGPGGQSRKFEPKVRNEGIWREADEVSADIVRQSEGR